MDYTGQRITVMGLGRFGGGVGVTQFLASRGAIVTVTDTATADQLADSVKQVEGLPNVTLVLGEHREQDFLPSHADLVVANPAVKPANEFLQLAHDAGVPVTTEIVLLVRELPNRLRTIGVTGSAGKSTTTAMIAHILRKVFGQEGESPSRQGAKTPSEQTDQSPDRQITRSPDPGVWMGGNIGGSLLPVVDQIGNDDWVVLELSSFMLHYLREEKWSPHVAVITNITPNHLDWHGGFETYSAEKHAILDFQVDGDSAVLGPEEGFGAAVQPNGLTVIVDQDSGEGFVRLSVPGMHNRINGMLALAATDCACIAFRSMSDMAAALEDFAGLPHRLEFVGDVTAGEPASAGVRWFNDSKSTTPEAAVLGIEAFAPGSVHVILGGYDKGSDLSAMCRAAAERCAGVYTIGAPATRSPSRGIGEPGFSGAGDRRALRHAGQRRRRDQATREPGEVALLSPGCASWDQFDNYEQRGERFVALVRGA